MRAYIVSRVSIKDVGAMRRYMAEAPATVEQNHGLSTLALQFPESAVLRRFEPCECRGPVPEFHDHHSLVIPRALGGGDGVFAHEVTTTERSADGVPEIPPGWG